MPPGWLALLFAAGVAVSLAASWLLVSRLERLAERAGFSEGWLGLVAALAADAPEITAAVTALARGQASVGAGVVVGSNVFNLAALLGLAAVAAGQIALHRRVVLLAGVPAVWIAGSCLLVVAAVVPPAAGLALAAAVLQLSSTQFSPRLLRNFLRDRPNQVVLSAFVATFAYSAAGLYTVGVSAGNRTAVFPRLAVSGAIVLLFVSLGLLVFFADHLVHSIQVDAIMDTVQRSTLAVIRGGLLADGQEAPEVPPRAVPVTSRCSGYVQAVHPGALLPHAARHGVNLRLRPRVGEHVVAGTTLAWIWHPSPQDPAPDPQDFTRILDAGIRIGFERTLKQDAAFGIRQLVDVACKALSPAVNDPYTAVQAVDHLSVIFCALARRPLGPHVACDGSGAAVIIPGRRFGDYLAVMCRLIRRYGAGEPTVAHALLRLLGSCAAVPGDDPERCAAIEEQARIIISDAEREVAQPADLALTHAEAESVLRAVARRRTPPA